MIRSATSEALSPEPAMPRLTVRRDPVITLRFPPAVDEPTPARGRWISAHWLWLVAVGVLLVGGVLS
jgi:hypothetical protein